jgi:hypothetical protein
MFDVIPYGDPYGAGIALFLIVAMLSKLAVDGKI